MEAPALALCHLLPGQAASPSVLSFPNLKMCRATEPNKDGCHEDLMRLYLSIYLSLSLSL